MKQTRTRLLTCSQNYLSRGFLLTYLATSLFTLYLPLVHGKELFDEWWQKR
jgi:hypothetical protein